MPCSQKFGPTFYLNLSHIDRMERCMDNKMEKATNTGSMKGLLQGFRLRDRVYFIGLYWVLGIDVSLLLRTSMSLYMAVKWIHFQSRVTAAKTLE